MPHRVITPAAVRAALAVVALVVTVSVPAGALAAELSAEPAELGIVGLPSPVAVSLTGDDAAAAVGATVEAVDARGEVVARATLDDELRATLEPVPSARGATELTVRLADRPGPTATVSLRAIAGWWAVLPPLLAVAVALIFRQVVPALLAGVWIGASVVDGGALAGALRLIDRYVVQAIADTDHASIVVFSLLLGGMVGVVSRSGGTVGLVERLTPYATSSRRGQLVTWLLGILIFFDDYANTLLVGNTMRGVTDRLRISREKLAYIVDSTAAPVASIALVSTWIGYEVSLIDGALDRLGSDREAYGVFLESLAYNFYPVLALVFGLLVATTGRDFGPMLRAERRAATGRLLADGAVPLADFESSDLSPADEAPKRWYNAVVPVLVVLTVTFLALWLTGRASLAEQGAAVPGGLRGLGVVFGEGDSFKALLWGSLGGCVVAVGMAVVQRILTLAHALEAWVAGLRSMTVAMVILVLAWAIAAVCADLRTDDVMVHVISDAVDPRLLPTIVFVVAAATAFATGTSWGTMGILIPLAVPTAAGMAAAAGLEASVADHVFLGSVSAVLAGAIFGDHCSPISDTTVMSSMSSGCDHVDHVRTQLPYALTVAVVAILFGYVPVTFDAPVWLCLPLAVAALYGVLLVVGRTDAG